MPNLVTVFEITRGSNGIWSDTLLRLAIGLIALLGGGAGLIRRWRRAGRWSDWVLPILTMAWASAWLMIHNFPHMFGHIGTLTNAYANHEYEVVEGEVKVLRRQPATGHSSGDIIVVDGKKFEINYFLATPAYRDTIAHGGVLKDGVHARIYHHDGAILRVDVERP